MISLKCSERPDQAWLKAGVSQVFDASLLGSSRETSRDTRERRISPARLVAEPIIEGIEIVERNAELPLVDPEFLLIERRPEKLHSYARGLLQHLRAIRAKAKAERYPITTIKAAAVWLIESYAEAGVPPATEAAHLISELIGPDPDASTVPVQKASEEAYWAAIEFEAGHPPDPKGTSPSKASRYAVAKHILGLLKNRNASQQSAEGTVRNWRLLPHYRANVALQRSARFRVKS